MNDFTNIALGIIAAAIVGLLVGLKTAYHITYEMTYERAYIDCLLDQRAGRPAKYELIQQENGETKWQATERAK